MKKHILATLMVLIAAMLAPGAFAQESRKEGKRKIMSREQFEKRKMDYIVKQADLTKEETKEFFPLLKRMNMKRRQYHERIRDLVEGERAGKMKTDADYLKMIREMSSCMEKEKAIEIQYLDSFLQVIPAKKYYKYKQVEMRFLNHMMRERGRRGHSRGDMEGTRRKMQKDSHEDLKGPAGPCPFD